MAENVLRLDERQQMIYNDPAQGAVVRGMEAWALKVLGTRLRDSSAGRIKALNGLGAWCQRTADGRLRGMQKAGGAHAVVADWILIVSKYAAHSRTQPMTPDVARALDELYQTAFYIDHRVGAAGTEGPGVHRAAVRGD